MYKVAPLVDCVEPETLAIAFVLVVIIIYLFLGNIKAVIVPAVALPVSLIASFLGIYLFDLSINIFVLLSFILAIGIITDDSVMLKQKHHAPRGRIIILVSRNIRLAIQKERLGTIRKHCGCIRTMLLFRQSLP